MEDQTLVNKPVKVEQIIEALRCYASDGVGGCCDCETCPFAEEVKLSNLVSIEHCNSKGIMRTAADRLANDQTHIGALQKEIEKLRSDRRWIPVTERLPEIESFGVSKVLLGIVENETGFPPPNPCFCVYLGDGKWSIRGRLATITHWMPLPEAPEVE